MTVREILESAYSETGANQTVAANAVGMSCKQLSDRMTRDTLKASTFLQILDSIGIDVEFKVRDTGFELREKKQGLSGHVTQMIHGVVYDTNKSYLVYSEPGSPGNFVELYQTKDRKYFVVDKSLYGGNDLLVTVPLTKNGAIDFLKEHNADEDIIRTVMRGL